MVLKISLKKNLIFLSGWFLNWCLFRGMHTNTEHVRSEWGNKGDDCKTVWFLLFPLFATIIIILSDHILIFAHVLFLNHFGLVFRKMEIAGKKLHKEIQRKDSGIEENWLTYYCKLLKK